MKIEFF